MFFQKRNVNDIHLIKSAARGDSQEIAAEIALGGAEFFTLGNCHFVTRTEQTPRGKELVIVCAQGKTLRPPLRKIINLAVAQQYDSLRWHPATKRSGAALARIGGLISQWFDDGFYTTDLRRYHYG
jgi:hypothetical protein